MNISWLIAKLTERYFLVKSKTFMKFVDRD